MKNILKKLLDFESLDPKVIDTLIPELERKGCTWRNLGDLEQNHARVNIVANPESTMIERITNAMDAVLDLHALTDQDVRKANSPREAVAKILGIKDGYLCNITEKEKETQTTIASKSGVEVFVKVNNGVNLFFRDFGIGLTSEEMPKTILTLNESNKFRKPYLIGQYGQGGSTTCAFSKYTVIISRKEIEQNEHVAFTIIRFNELTDDLLAKDGKFEYLVLDKNPPNVPAQGVDFKRGTVVIHLNYETEINKGFINYFQVLDHYLFDPPLPYSLYYEKWAKGTRRSLLGARRRIETSDLKQYQQEYVYKIDQSPQFGEVKIRYWLLKKAEEKEKKGEQIQEQVQANKFLYDDKNPILVTYNGQVQGTLPRTILKDDCKFGYIYKSLIVQIECEELTPAGKKFFFTSGRDRLKSLAQTELTNAVVTILSKDQYLQKENEDREQESLSDQIGKDTTEIRRKLAEMINRLNPGTFKVLMGAAKGSTGNGSKQRPGGTGKKQIALEPLPTQDEPSFIKISNKKDPIALSTGKVCKLLIESDAPDKTLTEKKWQLSLTPKSATQLKIHSISDFKGGRNTVFIKCDETCKTGEKYDVKIQISTDSNGLLKVIESNIRQVEIREPPQSSKNSNLEINAPEIIELTDKDKKYAEYSWNEQTVAEVKEGSITAIYVNMSNVNLLSMLKGGAYSEARTNRIRNQYLLQIAYHAFIQHLGFKDAHFDFAESQEEEVKKGELERVARTICTTIMAVPQE